MLIGFPELGSQWPEPLHRLMQNALLVLRRLGALRLAPIPADC